MSISKGKAVIRKLAMQKGVSAQEIRDEINIAIEMGMNSPDPAVRAYWTRIPQKGAKPTPEEAIIYLAKQV